MKLFTEGFLEILEIFIFLISTGCIAAGGQKVLFLANKRLSFKNILNLKKPSVKVWFYQDLYVQKKIRIIHKPNPEMFAFKL